MVCSCNWPKVLQDVSLITFSFSLFIVLFSPLTFFFFHNSFLFLSLPLIHLLFCFFFFHRLCFFLSFLSFPFLISFLIVVSIFFLTSPFNFFRFLIFLSPLVWGDFFPYVRSFSFMITFLSLICLLPLFHILIFLLYLLSFLSYFLFLTFLFSFLSSIRLVPFLILLRNLLSSFALSHLLFFSICFFAYIVSFFTFFYEALGNFKVPRHFIYFLLRRDSRF
ncbi:unnamed protein product [Acanthosepion pharaonis]|uniref:Uncharacterized protein n=1 Tax=Acanthosepion pharaonis TaxID=158019 RepID=A0A812BMD6_ACAPH|nr:unnamed protein product [Sepia pharaonis]